MSEPPSLREAMNEICGACDPHRWSDHEKKQIRLCFETLRRRELQRAKENLITYLKKMKDPMDLVHFRKEVTKQLNNTTAKSNFSLLYGLHIFARAIHKGTMRIDEFSFLNERKLTYLKQLTATEAMLQEQMRYLIPEEET